MPTTPTPLPVATTRTSLVALTTVLVGLAACAGANAATPAVTAQARAANAAFLAYAPAPTGGAGALCVVDTGVQANPDTAPGLISATAIDGGSGDDADPDGHGTSMAMIAGAAGQGMIGAWPQIKIVSVRATNVPAPGQEPTFEFNDYVQGMQRCLTLASQDHIHAIDLALSSTIPPSPDQAQNFANQVAVADGQNAAVVAAAGNSPGAIEEPAVEPGVFAVGASTAQGDQLSPTSPGSPCNFTATQGLTFYAPGCGLDIADPFTDQPSCCGNGTSQASAFAAAVIVALMSYDPNLTYTKAEQLLVSTATDGNLNVTAAFQADGLGSIVMAGSANIPQVTTTTTTTSSTTAQLPPAPPAAASKPAKPTFAVTSARWNHGILTLVVRDLGKKEHLRIVLKCAHRRPRTVTSRKVRTVIHTRRPKAVLVRVLLGKKKMQGPIIVHIG